MSDGVVLRRRFTAGERTFCVIGESWFDRASGEWKARVLFVPVDRSLPRGVASGALLHGARRDDVLRRLAKVSDRDLATAFHAIALPLPRRARGR
ncbi:MAG TPA: hypothetical protein VFS44_10875 [Gemmatimonadaceae bacterium]|nr:hypothetical protein [Gemmatimonadaceae bacterium]